MQFSLPKLGALLTVAMLPVALGAPADLAEKRSGTTVTVQYQVLAAGIVEDSCADLQWGNVETYCAHLSQIGCPCHDDPSQIITCSLLAQPVNALDNALAEDNQACTEAQGSYTGGVL